MISEKYAKQIEQMNLALAQINSDEITVELIDFDSTIRELWDASVSDDEKIACINLAASVTETTIRGLLLNDFAMKSYEAHDYNMAYYGFVKGAQSGSVGAKNNLAYMLRRGEICIIESDEDIPFVVLELLLQGLKTKESFSIVNAALVFCLLLGEDNDWKIADDLFRLLPLDNIQSINTWWSNLENEIEGCLVHFFLLRHNKIKESRYGSLRNILHRLKTSIDGFPQWLIESYETGTLNDVLEHHNDEDFD